MLSSRRCFWFSLWSSAITTCQASNSGQSKAWFFTQQDALWLWSSHPSIRLKPFLKISNKPSCLFFYLVSELSEIGVSCNEDSLGSESVWIRMDSSGDGALKFIWPLFHSEDWSNGVNSWPSDFYQVISSCTKCSLQKKSMRALFRHLCSSRFEVVISNFL